MKNLILILSVILFASCERGVKIHSRFTKAEYEKMGNAVMGTYHGKYMTFVWTQDSLIVHEIPDATVSVSAWDKQQIVFHDFPISLLSKTLAEDSFVSQYFASRPNQDLTAQYTFNGISREVDGTIFFQYKFLNSISFTTGPDSLGKKHYIELPPTSGHVYSTFTMDECEGIMILRNRGFAAVDFVDMTDNGKSLVGEWPCFTHLQVRFLAGE